MQKKSYFPFAFCTLNRIFASKSVDYSLYILYENKKGIYVIDYALPAIDGAGW